MNETDLKNIEPLQLFKLLYKSVKPIKHWVQQNSGNSADAEDVVQDAMIVFYQMIHQPDFVLNAKPETLLFGIAKKKWLYQLRKDKRMPLSASTDHLQLSEEESDSLEREGLFKVMEKSLVLLGDKCSELLQMFYFKKMDMVQIAAELGFRNDKVAKAMKYKCLEKARVLVNAKNNEMP